MAAAKYCDKRKNVMVGNLPDDFLRVSPSNSEASSPMGHTSSPSTQTVLNVPHRSVMNQVVLCIVQAQLAKNYSLTKMDPYVRVRIGHSVYETQSDARGGKFPNWNKTITAYLPPGIKSIYIEVFDEHTLTSDERIAHAEYVIPDEALQGKFIDTWVPLNGRQGEGKEGAINITVYITPTNSHPSLLAAPTPIMVIPQPAVTPMPYYMSAQPVIQYPAMHPQPMMNPNYGYPSQPMQQQQLQRPPVTEQDVKQLEEMFPSYDKEVILGVLEGCNNNKEQAITSLLSLGDK